MVKTTLATQSLSSSHTQSEGVTRAQVEIACQEWIKRLKLEHHDITIIWPEDYSQPERDPEWDSGTREASMWRARDYDQAQLYFNPEAMFKMTRMKMNLLIVHELLHIVTKEAEYILDNLDGLLHRDVDGLISNHFQHAMEGVVDRLAYRLVELGGIA